MAEIPYGFNIGQKSYRAGSYTIKISKLSPNIVSLSLEDKEKNKLQTILGRENGSTTEREPKLVFTSYNNRRFLTGVFLREMELAIAVSKDNKLNTKAKERQKSKEIVIVIASNK